MAKNKSFPKFKSVDELAEFFEIHDMGDYWEQMPEAHFDIDLKKRTHIIRLDADLSQKLDILSKRRRIPSERLVNSWLREKLHAQK